MSFLWRAIGLGGSSIPNFPFTLGETVDCLSGFATLPWTVRSATRNEDNARVTVFEIAVGPGQQQATIDMARNVLKRAKTLMLPGFLRCYDSVEYNNTVYIATEECTSLVRVLEDPAVKVDYYDDEGEKFNEGVALGLRHVAQALVAVHNHNLVHGNVCHESVFVVRSGEWKLFGLELVAGHNEENGLYRRYWSVLPDYRRPPETMSGAATAPMIHNVDAWGVGALIYGVYGGIASDRLAHAKGTDMRSCRSMPRTLQSGFTGLTGTNPKLRMPLDKFLSDTEFIVGSEYVQSLQQLDELALKDATDRDAVYRKLTTLVDSFPLRACKYIILVKLSAAVQYGGGSATALEPILKIGSLLTDPAAFAELVAPIVMTLFGSSDPMVRVRLLTSAGQYAPLLPPALVNERIWGSFCTGFNSANANMRELTVRALVHFAPLLNEKNFNADVIRFITSLQQDREGPIRTNATICLCLIAEHVPEATRAKTLVHGFGRMLKDPFQPSRVAALRSIHSTLSYYPPNTVAELIVPGVVPLCIDPTLEIRQLAFKIVDGAVETLKKHAATMPAAPPSATGGEDASSNTSGSSTPLAKSSSVGGGLWSWGSAAKAPGSSLPTTPVVVSPAAAAAASGEQRHADPLSSSSSTTAAANPPTQGASVSPQPAPVSVAVRSTTTAPPKGTAPESSSWEDELVLPSRAPVVATPPPPSGGTGMKLKKKGFGGASKVE